MITIDDIRELALALPKAEERASYGGRPSWRAGPRMFAWVREDPEALVVWVESVEDKDALISSAPEQFFSTDHYEGSPIVLVNLASIDAQECGELLADSYRVRATRTLVAELDKVWTVGAPIGCDGIAASARQT